MLFTYTLFLLCACIAIASPWNGNHYIRHHQHLTELGSLDSVNPAASPVVDPAPFPEKILATRQSEDDEYDECSDEDEEDEDESTQPQAGQAGSPQASSTSSATPIPTPAENALYHVAGPDNPSVPYANATFPAAQVIAVSTSAGAPAPSPPTTSDIGQAGAAPVLPNLPVSSVAVAASAPSTAAAGVLTASFTR